MGIAPRSAAAACVAAAALLAPVRALAQPIRAIVIHENTKTNDETVLLIAGIREGDEWSYELADQVRLRLVSSFLFQTVEVTSAPYRGGVKVTPLARDKHSWVVGPTFYNQPGNRGAGLGFLEANLLGTAKRLVLYGQIATADSFFLAAFQDPRIGASRFSYQLDVFLRREVVTEYSVPAALAEDTRPVRDTVMSYLNAGAKGGVALGAFVAEARLRGAHVSYDDGRLADDAVCADVVHVRDAERLAGQCDEATREAPEPGANGYDVSGEIVLQIDRRANVYGIRTGSQLALSYERGLPQIGSDFAYWYAGLTAFRGAKSLLLAKDNATARAALGYGEDIPFQQEYSAGGPLLRGYRHRQFRGDFRAGGTLEYSVPLFSIWSLSFRMLGFYDTTYIGFHDQEQ
jgi:outer membrane protein assembly factor BamA